MSSEEANLRSIPDKTFWCAWCFSCLYICSSDFLVRYRNSRQVQIFLSRYRFSLQGTYFLIKVQKISSGTEVLVKLRKLIVKSFVILMCCQFPQNFTVHKGFLICIWKHFWSWKQNKNKKLCYQSQKGTTESGTNWLRLRLRLRLKLRLRPGSTGPSPSTWLSYSWEILTVYSGSCSCPKFWTQSAWDLL